MFRIGVILDRFYTSTLGTSARRKRLYVFLTALFLVLILVPKEYFVRTRNTAMEKSIFRVAFPHRRPATDYDPVKIPYASHYFFLQNIYSPLVEYSLTGELVSAVAEKFQWIGTEAHFKIRPGLQTIDGDTINANDVAMSFKRLFMIGGNTHGDLKRMLCPGVKLHSLNDACPGMSVSPDGSEFVLKFKEKKIFLFSMLAAMDFAVIPTKAIDPKTLKIMDYRNTSGPYYVSKDDVNGHIEFAANPRHFHYSDKIPQDWVFVVPKDGDSVDSLKLFSAGEVDHLTTKDSSDWEKVKYAHENKEVVLHQSLPLNLNALVFTERGLKRFSETERIAIAKKLKALFLARYSVRPGYGSVEQIIPVFGEGGLSPVQLSELNNKFNAVKDAEVFDKPFTCWNYFGAEDSTLEKHFPKGKFIWTNSIPDFTDSKKQKWDAPDFYLFRGDTGFQEDVGFIFYYFSMNFFEIKESDKKKWLDKYLSTESKKERIEMLQDLHYKTILDAKVFPVAIESYSAIVRKPWQFSFSKYHASNQIWRIHQ